MFRYVYKRSFGEEDSQGFFAINGIIYKFVDGRDLILIAGEMQIELINLVREKKITSQMRKQRIM